MYSAHQHPSMPPPGQAPQRQVAPETFLLDEHAQQSLPQDSVVALAQVDNLKYFLISAPVDWVPDQYIRRFLLPTGEYVSCVLWSNLFHISGTDIVRCLSFRFQAFGRPVKNPKKFEEGIFSDLRNLKSGTDASLEEPKSAFLDFLYKNNCIRTQKKQKVFYWYSVPHDRLFLDALERDLKREKMGQEATTHAVSEPALSFEFDSSQSLFEQLTKAQQGNQSSFNAQSSSNSASPVTRNAESMPPPAMIPQQQMQHAPQQQSSQYSMPPPAMHDETLTHVPTYSQMAIPPMPMMPSQIQKTREQSVGPVFDRNGMQLSQTGLRHSSMPAYMEYSPAPSFISSHYEDFSQRGLSFEPITPPHHNHGIGAEPSYIANDETGLYTAIPDYLPQHSHPLMQGANTMTGAQYPSMARSSQPAPNLSGLDGSPTYKQRRRGSSMTRGMSASAVASIGPVTTRAVQRPSDLRRSMSAAVMPIPEGHEVSFNDSPTNMHMNNYTAQPVSSHKESYDSSRHTTPSHTLDSSFDESALQQHSHTHHGVLSQAQSGDFPQFNATSYQHASAPLRQHHAVQHANGVIRRARSATASELGPYSGKSHSCPIPMCGRLFKRLEHLKRHVRTHTQERPYICQLCNKAFSRSDNLAQHKRTHETSADGSAPSEEEMEDAQDDVESTEGASQQDSVISGDLGLAIDGAANGGATHFTFQQQHDDDGTMLFPSMAINGNTPGQHAHYYDNLDMHALAAGEMGPPQMIAAGDYQ